MIFQDSTYYSQRPKQQFLASHLTDLQYFETYIEILENI